jgi:hypothetical protein
MVQRIGGGWWRARARDGREGYLEGVHHQGQNAPGASKVSPPRKVRHATIKEFKDEH